MATQTGTTLKTYFNTGDQPTEAQLGDLIDSNLNLTDGGAVTGTTTFTGLNRAVNLIAGNAGNDTTINTLASGYVYHIGTTTGAIGATDDDDARTLKLPTPSAAGEVIKVYWMNAANINKLVGIALNTPASQTLTYYAFDYGASTSLVETATTATGTDGTQNTMVKIAVNTLKLGDWFEFTSQSTTSWRVNIHSHHNQLAAGDIAVDPGNSSGYID